MNQEIPVYEIALPEYTVATKPDYQAIGDKLERKILEIFADRPTIMRSLTVADHPGISLDELVQIVLDLGHDRHDPQCKGVLYPDDTQEALYSVYYEGEAYDMARTVGLFYTGPPADRNGPPIRLDLLLFYDPTKMTTAPWVWNEGLQGHVPVSHLDDQPRPSEQLYWFRDPGNKPGALLGLLKILR